MANRIDHFAVGCHSLERGVQAMKQLLGVSLPYGSKHTLMSTHNCVMQTGNESFFELIAIDPEAPDPGRVRWFTLDDPNTAERLAVQPCALCWVVGTDNLDELVANSPVPLGEIVTFTRGERSWRLTVPQDGHLPEGGLLPAFIEWSPGPHPSTAQPDLGVQLRAVRLTHPDPDRLNACMQALDVSHLAKVSEGHPAIAFELQTPMGVVTVQ